MHIHYSRRQHEIWEHQENNKTIIKKNLMEETSPVNKLTICCWPLEKIALQVYIKVVESSTALFYEMTGVIQKCQDVSMLLNKYVIIQLLPSASSLSSDWAFSIPWLSLAMYISWQSAFCQHCVVWQVGSHLVSPYDFHMLYHIELIIKDPCSLFFWWSCQSI